MTAGNVGLAAHIEKEASTTNPLKNFLSRYFHLSMAFVLAGLVILGFRRTVNAKFGRPIEMHRSYRKSGLL